MGRAVIAGVILVLLSVNLSSLREAGRLMLVAFAIGAVGSDVGAVVMALVVRGAVGPETWKLSGQFTATYIGGGMNFAAVGQELQTRSDLFAAGIAADVIVTAIWLVACLVIPELFPRPAGTAAALASSAADAQPGPGHSMALQLRSSGVPMTLTDFAGLTVVTLGTIWASDLCTGWWPAIPKVI